MSVSTYNMVVGWLSYFVVYPTFVGTNKTATFTGNLKT